jgi:hypothetical protein
LKDVERGDEVESCGREWNVADAGLRDPVAMVMRERHAGAGEIEADGIAERTQHLEIRAGAAAAIENARRPDPASGARDHRPHVLTEAAKPEVRLLGSIGQFK